METVQEENSQKKFLENETPKWACVRSIEIIGEATKWLSDEFRQEYEEITWGEMAGMRDHLIHEYFGVDYGIVWSVIENKIPQLNPRIETVVKELEEG